MKKEELQGLVLKHRSNGVAYNERLREIEHLLLLFNFTEQELDLLARDIYDSLPAWRKNQLAKEQT